VRVVAELCSLSPADAAALGDPGAGLPIQVADRMIENAIGVIELPLGIGLNFVVNGRDYLVPMAVEEPSVIAAVSSAAKLVRSASGFDAAADPPLMIAQIQIAGVEDARAASTTLLEHRAELLGAADALIPAMVRRGGGARDLEVRLLEPAGSEDGHMLAVHFIVDTRDAMGANVVNTLAEGLAPQVERLIGGRVFLRILSNLADRRLARASCRVPIDHLEAPGVTGRAVAEGIVQGSRFASADPYRAATHNKGIMNGIDAVAIATGNDWRAIEAGAHAYAAREGRYGPLSTWEREGDALVGRIELPLAVGTVGGSIEVHPRVRAVHRIMGVTGARELAGLMAAVGLAQNLAALRALGSVGIQRGHMAQHRRKHG
jgi:hydroxymethylglutaryl-CoA reductase